jgi:hypothetical protein
VDTDTNSHQFIAARTAKQRLDIAFSAGQYPWGPGAVLRYNNLHSFVLAAAMDSFLKRQAGPNAHLWDMMTAEVFRPLGIVHAPMLHTQETDGGHGLPHLLHGLYPTVDDLAKLTTLLQNGGQHQGQQLLSATKLAEALYKTAAMGLPTGGTTRFGEARYHLSFWSVPYRTASGCFFQIPYMAGLGGNVVVLLPNGITAFRFADGERYDVDTMVRAGEALRPFPCPAGSGTLPPPQPQPLTASELQAELPGHTFYADPLTMLFPTLVGAHFNFFVTADGLQYATLQAGPNVGAWHDAGRWRLTPEGDFCRTWFLWDNRRERCFTGYREGETFVFYPKDGLGKQVFRRSPGNPEGY